jgi:hypothetical protein
LVGVVWTWRIPYLPGWSHLIFERTVKNLILNLKMQKILDGLKFAFLDSKISLEILFKCLLSKLLGVCVKSWFIEILLSNCINFIFQNTSASQANHPIRYTV